MGSKASRNTSIEALRLVAVAGIAIFHTFQWTFQAVCTGLPEYAPLAVFPYSGALGFINLLGCWANEVFFMISGYFLIPSAIRALQNGSSARGLIYKSFTRLKKIVLPTLFYCTACLFVSMYVYPLPEISLHEIGWLTLGIEFIWVYAASVLLVPMIALARQRIGSKRAPFVVALLVFATFGINCYIAATANEVAGVVLWRKLMSAVTYLVAFIAAGEMRFVLEHHGNASGAQKSKIALIGLIAATVTLELLLSTNSQYDALWKLSYKSTSVISFILAVASVAGYAMISNVVCLVSFAAVLAIWIAVLVCSIRGGAQGGRRRKMLIQSLLMALPLVVVLGYFVVMHDHAIVHIPVFGCKNWAIVFAILFASGVSALRGLRSQKVA